MLQYLSEILEHQYNSLNYNVTKKKKQHEALDTLCVLSRTIMILVIIVIQTVQVIIPPSKSNYGARITPDRHPNIIMSLSSFLC